MKGGPSPARGEGVEVSGRRGENRELNDPVLEGGGLRRHTRQALDTAPRFVEERGRGGLGGRAARRRR